jgi:uncharacterized iron-regulated protein
VKVVPKNTRERVLTINREKSREIVRKIRSLAPLPSELSEYAKESEPRFEKIKTCTVNEFIEDAASARILYVEDEYTHERPKRFFEMLLREFFLRKRKIVVATDLFDASQQNVMAQYLRSGIHEATFKELASQHKRVCTETQWSTYEDLFVVIRRLDMPLVAIGNYSNEGIEARERKIAKNIKEMSEYFPNALICVFIDGQHLRASHLPAKVEEEFRVEKPKQVILFQNSEKLYEKLVKMGLEQKTDIVNIDEGVYCVINSTPLARHLSDYWYVLHDENNAKMHMIANVYLSVLSRLLLLKHQIKMFDANIESDAEAVKSFTEKADDILPQEIISEAKSNRAVVLPTGPIIYLPSLSLHDLLSTLGTYAHFKIIQHRSRKFAEGVGLFYDEVLHHSLSQLMTRFVDHKKRSAAIEEMNLTLHSDAYYLYSPFEITCAETLTRYLEFERRLLRGEGDEHNPYYFLKGALRYELLKKIGELLGDRIFDAFISDEFSVEKLREILCYEPQKTDPRELYFELKRSL